MFNMQILQVSELSVLIHCCEISTGCLWNILYHFNPCLLLQVHYLKFLWRAHSAAQITVQVHLESKEVIHSTDDDVDACCASCLSPQVVLKICSKTRLISLKYLLLTKYITDLILAQTSFKTWVFPTIIMAFTEQLQESEEVTGELIICHHFLI